MIASLMMYNHPALHGAIARYWTLIREELRNSGIDSPETLAQEAEEFSVWRHPDLVLSQTCGMPYRLWLHDQVSLVGTPNFAVEGCPAGYYRSAIIVRQDDHRTRVEQFKDGVLAYNQTFSQSGYAALHNHIDFAFAQKLHTQQHALSARVVVDGEADIAAIDAVTWRLLCRYEPFCKNLRVLEWTEPTPALPLITAKGNDAEAIFHGVSRAISCLLAEDAEMLGIHGLIQIPKQDYLSVSNPPY